MDLVVRQDICEEEKSYIQKRLKIVGDCLRRHGIECKPDELPRVALLGSGGGQRAKIALLGVLRQLGEEDLLDCFLHLAGVSGSTWAMASLYADDLWSKNVIKATSNILNNISKGKGVTFSEGVQWLKGRHEEGDLSLSDPWGVIVCDMKGVPLETRFLSDEGNRDCANPYPLYSAIDRELFDKGEVRDLWFELSPHEAGFTEPGAFIKTSLLKQNFEEGRVQYNPNRKRMDMVQLQGICGGVFGDALMMKKGILDYIKSHLPWLPDDSSQLTGVLQIVMALFELVECTHYRTECSHEVLARLKTLLGENHGKCSSTLLELDFEMWTSGHLGDEDKRERMVKIFEELIDSSEEWGQDLNNVSDIFSDVWWVMKHILPLFSNWQFGNVANFLHQFNDPSVPEEMCKRDIMHLIDAGLFLNSPYPSVLREARDVDLIISFDFSEDKPFETVDKAQKYVVSNNRAFPDVKHQDQGHLMSFHVSKDMPTVIHIPLFNIENCKDESTIKQEQDAYTTFQMMYRDTVKINHLADLAAKNVKMNREGILKEIRKAAERRMAKF